MISITYFFRNIKAGYSIEKSFKPTIEELIKDKKYDIKIYHVPYYRADPIRILRNIIFIYRHRNKHGINHITGDIHYGMLGLIGVKSVLTIHDLVLIRHTKNKIKKFLYQILWYKIPCKIADRVTCISNTTLEDLKSIVHLPDDKAIVIYNAVDSIFKYYPKGFNHSMPNILHIGTSWNKNLPKVIEALEGIKCNLTIIGSIDSSMKSSLHTHKIKYTNKQKLSDEEIVEEYNRSDIISFPSIFEGFGMPIVEGQSIGRPVLTSNINPMKEIAGDGACLIDPQNTSSIRKGFLSIINSDSYRGDLVESGIDNIKRFSSTIISQNYKHLYNELK